MASRVAHVQPGLVPRDPRLLGEMERKDRLLVGHGSEVT